MAKYKTHDEFMQAVESHLGHELSGEYREVVRAIGAAMTEGERVPDEEPAPEPSATVPAA